MGASACGGKGFKVRAAVSGERLMDAASWGQQYNQASCHPPPPNPRVGNQPTYPRVEDSLLKRRTRAYTRKYQRAYSLSLYTPPPVSASENPGARVPPFPPAACPLPPGLRRERADRLPNA